jgi:hypothetical protein
METLERLWDAVSNGAAGAGTRLERFLTGLFGSSNARYLRRLLPIGWCAASTSTRATADSPGDYAPATAGSRVIPHVAAPSEA